MQFFKRKSLFVILIGLILLGSLIGYSLTNKNEPSKIEMFVMDSVGWLQHIVFQPITFVTGVVDGISDIRQTYEENKLLREKIAEYKTLVYEVQELEKENESLRQLVNLLDSPRDYEPILGTVIARSPERWIDQVIINQGKQHGIEKNMAVITGEGIVGKVKSVSNFTSTVQLITSFDQMNRMSAVVSPKKGKDVFGLIEGYDKDKGMLLFRIIDDTGSKIKEGDPVLSSSMGGMFPSGLLIGTIDDVKPDQYGLTKIAYVKPAADLTNINEVIVVKRSLETISEDEMLQPVEIDEDEEDDQ